MDNRAHFTLTGKRPEPPIEPLEGPFFGGCRFTVDAQSLAANSYLDLSARGDHTFKRNPPEITDAIGKARGHVEDEWDTVPLQDRPSIAQIIAVAVVKCECDEAATEIAFLIYFH